MDKKYHCWDIDWDTLDDDGMPMPISVPTEFDVEIDGDAADIEDAIADALSDEVGYCVNGFRYRPI